MNPLKSPVTVENYWGRKFEELECSAEVKPTILKFDALYEGYGPAKSLTSYTDADWQAAFDEMTAAKVTPTLKEQVTSVNNRIKAAARSKAALAAVLAAGFVQPKLESDEELQIAVTMKGIVARGVDVVEARRRARIALGLPEETAEEVAEV